MNKKEAWEKFRETGKIEYYLKYKEAEKKWDSDNRSRRYHI